MEREWVDSSEIRVGDTVYGIHDEEDRIFVVESGFKVVSKCAKFVKVEYGHGDVETVKTTALFLIKREV